MVVVGKISGYSTRKEFDRFYTKKKSCTEDMAHDKECDKL
jgi:hypothetical protein